MSRLDFLFCPLRCAECVDVYINIIHTHTHTCIHIYVCIHLYIYVCIYTYMTSYSISILVILRDRFRCVAVLNDVFWIVQELELTSQSLSLCLLLLLSRTRAFSRACAPSLFLSLLCPSLSICLYLYFSLFLYFPLFLSLSFSLSLSPSLSPSLSLSRPFSFTHSLARSLPSFSLRTSPSPPLLFLARSLALCSILFISGSDAADDPRGQAQARWPRGRRGH